MGLVNVNNSGEHAQLGADSKTDCSTAACVEIDSLTIHRNNLRPLAETWPLHQFVLAYLQGTPKHLAAA